MNVPRDYLQKVSTGFSITAVSNASTARARYLDASTLHNFRGVKQEWRELT